KAGGNLNIRGVLLKAVAKSNPKKTQAGTASLSDIKARKRNILAAADLLEAAASISSKLSLEEVAQEAARQIVEVLGVDACALSKWDQEADTITLWAEYTRSGEKIIADWRQPSKLSKYPYAQQVLRSGEGIQLNVDDLPADEIMRKFLERMGAMTILILPLVAGERVIGLIEILANQENYAINQQTETIKLLANHAGIGIERAQLLQQAEHRAVALEALHRASLSVTASLNLEDVLHSILESTLGLLQDALDAHVFLHENGQLTFGAALWADGSKGKVWANPRPGGVTYTVARTGEIFLIPNIKTHPLYKGAPQEWEGSIVSIPLKISNRVVGVMNIAYKEPREFTTEELQVINLLADQAALAVENARLHDLVLHEALTDPLTGLSNRRAFDQRLEEEIRRSIRYQHQFALVILDFDDFKHVNDTYGHPAGDETLREVGRYMREEIRDTDFAARIGGDEFALILPETKLENAESICALMREMMLESMFAWQDENDTILNPSTGIASFPIDATNGKDLIAAADNALYRRKKKQEG
ncbi:MAG: diguanylate cyclase, partial [Chloroflexota bacterium]